MTIFLVICIGLYKNMSPWQIGGVGGYHGPFPQMYWKILPKSQNVFSNQE